VDAAGPVAPNHLDFELAAATFHFDQITDDRHGTINSVLVGTKLMFRYDFTVLQSDALYPVAHREDVTSASGPVKSRLSYVRN
jgi:hypothetical protein